MVRVEPVSPEAEADMVKEVGGGGEKGESSGFGLVCECMGEEIHSVNQCACEREKSTDKNK